MRVFIGMSARTCIVSVFVLGFSRKNITLANTRKREEKYYIKYGVM
jgi:hypothetical protein